MSLIIEHDGPVSSIIINRPQARNAVDRETGVALRDAFAEFEADEEKSVAILSGAEGAFCAGADLKAVAQRSESHSHDPRGEGAMGPSRMLLKKPVIAAVEGHAVAGGLELALWCDLRVASANAVFGVYCRRWGVPLIDGGTIRLSRLIGHSRALDMILTGRGVDAEEALSFGLANRVVAEGEALAAALELAQQIARFPQLCLRADRESSYRQWGMSIEEALIAEGEGGLEPLAREAKAGAARFAAGKGRGGGFADI